MRSGGFTSRSATPAIAPLAALALVAATMAACPASADQPARPSLQPSAIVHTQYGDLAGIIDGGVSAYKAIPYAAPPTGDLRWRAPQAPAGWTGVRDAGRYGDQCLQNKQSWDSSASPQAASENCLTLNIWTPATKPEAPLPVMVWIHGGGLVSGSGTSAMFDGASLAQRGVIIVTFDYRLGRFGFFAHPALSKENADGALGDYGLMDQIAVLKWVKANIAAFGGDAANITIFGESSGGESVNRLMLSPAAEGLFAKAIAESGGGRNPWKPLGEAEAIGKAFALKAHVTADDPAALRAIPATKVLGGINMFSPEADTYSGPILDGRLVREEVAQGFAAGHAAKVPYLVGSNSDELGVVPGILLTPMTEKAAAVLGPDKPAVVAAYGSTGAFHAHFASDLNFTEPARALASFAARTGQPAYLYRFGYVAHAGRNGHGAAHASELPFVFGNTTADPEDRAAADLMGAYWTNFAKTGDPNGPGLPRWPAYSAKDDQLLAITPDAKAEAAKAGSPALDAITAHYTGH
jgi:para-nitrobenzyl esterase